MRIGDDIIEPPDWRVYAYHEAGHAIVNVYVGMPFESVASFRHPPGGLVDFDEESDCSNLDAEMLIKRSKSTPAGVLATKRFDSFHPNAPLSHPPCEGESDEQCLKKMAESLRLDEPEKCVEDWKDQAAKILVIPWVWAAVEELARRLEASESGSRILQEEVRTIFEDERRK